MVDIIQWCKDEIVKMKKQIQYFESGSRLQENRGNGWVDVTDNWKNEYWRRIADLNNLLSSIEPEKSN